LIYYRRFAGSVSKGKAGACAGIAACKRLVPALLASPRTFINCARETSSPLDVTPKRRSPVLPRVTR
jgi:hypothetical protein